MRILCLFLPRLGIQLLEREHPELRSQPIVLMQGHGDSAAVSGASASGVACGTLAGQARRAAPEARFMPDNASDCLGELDRLASIIRRMATPLVEVGGRDHLFVDMDGLADRFGNEANAAARLASMLHECTRFEVRAAVAATRSSALKAARAARRTVQILDAEAANAQSVGTPRDESLSVSFGLPRDQESAAADRAVIRQLDRLGDVVAARRRGYRSLEVQLVTADEVHSVFLRPSLPMYTGEDIVHAWNAARPDLKLAGVEEVRVLCSGPAPDVRIQPRAAAAPSPAFGRVARPRQIPLRASA